MTNLVPQENPGDDLDAGGPDDFVGLTQHRLALYRQHRANVDMVFDQVADSIDALKGQGFPINFERVNSDTAALRNDEGEKVVEMTIERMQPIMLYPAKVLAEQQAAAAQAHPGQRVQQMMADDDEMPGMHPLYAPDDDDDGIMGMAKDGAPRAQAGDDEPRPVTIQEIEEQLGGGEERPEANLPPGARMIQFDGTRGLPESPVPEESLIIKVSSNIEGQPDEIQIVYDMADPVRNMSFSAHLADVAAYVKDQAERPDVERGVDGTPFKPEPTGLGFRP
ncbi:MAG: hypothetical protein KI792_12790 [Alphaproteobacteria bacterium]|nr:hypothetical protein [Alphaproteobacteria bacterium SS10]